MQNNKKIFVTIGLVVAFCFAAYGYFMLREANQKLELQQAEIRQKQEQQMRMEAERRRQEELARQKMLAERDAAVKQEQLHQVKIQQERNANIRANKPNIGAADWREISKSKTFIRYDYNLDNMYIDEDGCVHTIMAMALPNVSYVSIISYRVNCGTKKMQLLKAVYLYRDGTTKENTNISHEWGDEPVAPGSPIDKYYDYLAANSGAMSKIEKGLPSEIQVPIPIVEGDFVIGGFSLGDSKEKALSMFGTPQKEVKEEGKLHTEYGDIEVYYQGGKAIAIYSKGINVASPRGLREGDSLSAMIAEYGDNYEMFSFEGDNMYEYRGALRSGEGCILRFAINPKDEKIRYLGCRIQ